MNNHIARDKVGGRHAMLRSLICHVYPAATLLNKINTATANLKQSSASSKHRCSANIASSQCRIFARSLPLIMLGGNSQPMQDDHE